MSRITCVLLLTALSVIGMSFGNVLLVPKDKFVQRDDFSLMVYTDTIEPELPIEEMEEDPISEVDNLPLDVPPMSQGEVASIICNDEEEMDSYTINYSGLSDDALEEYKAILEVAGYDTDAIVVSEEGSMLKAQDGFVSLVVLYNDGAATINADLM